MKDEWLDNPLERIDTLRSIRDSDMITVKTIANRVDRSTW